MAYLKQPTTEKLEGLISGGCKWLPSRLPEMNPLGYTTISESKLTPFPVIIAQHKSIQSATRLIGPDRRFLNVSPKMGVAAMNKDHRMEVPLD